MATNIQHMIGIFNNLKKTDNEYGPSLGYNLLKKMFDLFMSDTMIDDTVKKTITNILQPQLILQEYSLGKLVKN